MQATFLTLNGVPTKVATWGKQLGEEFEEDEEKDIVIFFPGNPGVLEYYKNFLELLHKKLGKSVWAVGHSGHERPEKEKGFDVPTVEEQPELFTLKANVEQKAEFIENNVPANARLTLIGHSAGTYIITQLLKIPAIKERTVKSYLLFPTIEYIGDTPNGKFYRRFVQPVIRFTLFLSWVFNLFPYKMQYLFVLLYTFFDSVPRMHIETLIRFVDPIVLSRVFYMASDEMKVLKERENEVIKENYDRIKIFFGNSDGWSPVSYYEKIKKDIPEVDAEVCKSDVCHAFCLRSYDEISDMVSKWILEQSDCCGKNSCVK